MLTRREFLKRAGAVTAGATIASVSGINIKPVQAQVSKIKLQVKEGRQVPSVCPYCSVGCGMIITESEGKIINIEGNPDSPLNLGSLCPKGAAAFQLVENDNRPKEVLYRAPHSTSWETKPLDWAMDRIAEKVKEDRDNSFIEKQDGKLVNVNPALASLGGSTLENEWNYIHAKLMRGLGVVNVENHARI
jgi:formate dehydrogenase major subunit|nr:twin-arginine translocation signal domain-containing protein [Evansella clarkii]